jgi:hypothetical protein
VQELLVAGAPTGQIGRRSDRYAASVACTRNPLPERDPVGEGVSWVDLASACQLDPSPSAAGMKVDKKLGFGREN